MTAKMLVIINIVVFFKSDLHPSTQLGKFMLHYLTLSTSFQLKVQAHVKNDNLPILMSMI